MTLDEAIKHAEEVAEENQRVVDTGIVFDDVTIDMLCCDDTEVIEEYLANYRRRADEYRQLAEWLKDYKRLLKQSTSEDCISRQAVIDMTGLSDWFESSDDYNSFVEDLCKLPPVTPKIPTSDDCVSRQAVEKITWEEPSYNDALNVLTEVRDKVRALPPVTPIHCIASVRFSKDELREICNERIEIECTHGTCKDCEDWDKENHLCYNLGFDTGKNWYCADFKKAR